MRPALSANGGLVGQSRSVPATDDPAEQQRLEAAVGHPQERFDRLCERIQNDVVRTFGAVEGDFLALLWCMDTYRSQQVCPRGMGKLSLNPDRRLEGIYRGKGNWFSTVVSLILGNKTTSRLASRSDVMGFSQPHQIDIAWPARDVVPIQDPLICCEAKLTGAPAYSGNTGRGPMDDWSNRRKELKFQATDLKLYRQASGTSINHWDRWRKKAPPSCYSLWAARLRPPRELPQRRTRAPQRDDVQSMIDEAQILSNTYADGVGIYAFQENPAGTGYEAAPLSRGVGARVTSLDSVLDYIAAEIKDVMDANHGQVPPPVAPPDHPASTDV